MLTAAGEDRYVKVRLLFISDGFWLKEMPFGVELRKKFSLLQSPGMTGLGYGSSCVALVSSSDAVDDVKGTSLRFFIYAADIFTNHSQKKKNHAD
jgi:hypothetical protein